MQIQICGKCGTVLNYMEYKKVMTIYSMCKSCMVENKKIILKK